ncbi:unnamed protein product [Rhizoctonia solani]|uniref:Protein kinase domain-containing protein n=1 Tax=Rhizoctonia solani TaxID=456999 RepID=A0A8H3E3D5_9AGAM|nr:unnamed protein product [Rhizoctonia solani]
MCKIAHWNGKELTHAAHELYTWSKCDHPGVLKVLGFAVSDDSILLVSPWMQSGSLTRYLERNCVYDRLQLCIDLATTVAYLHEKGIVHGDIKTDNIVVSDDGGILLVDFGSAALVNYFTLRFTRTSPHLSWSVRFAAPEIVLEVITTHTAKSDVYSLGMTILQILTGEPPYADKSDMGVIILLAKAVKKTPLPRSMAGGLLRNQYADSKLWELLLGCWDHDPNLRPTAMEVKQTLVDIKRMSNHV